MIDVLSLLTGIIALTTGINKAIDYAKAVHHAPEELKELQACLKEQIHDFANVTQEIDDQQGSSASAASAVTTTLSNAKVTLERLRILLEVKLSTRVNDSPRKSRRAWAKNRSKLYKIQCSLREHRANLLLAIATNSLSSATRSEATLLSINRQVNCPNQSSSLLEAQLHNIQDSISKTYDAVMSLKDASYKDHASSTSPLDPRPVTLLETSHNFFPETYTTDSRLQTSRLVLLSAYQQSFCADYLANVYRVFYLKSPRQWCRLTISLNVSRSSKYWTATKTTPEDFERGRPSAVRAANWPSSLAKLVQTTLSHSDELDDNAEICLSLSSADTISWREQPRILDGTLTARRSSSPSLDALCFLHDLGCPWYVEDEVVQIEMLGPSTKFASWINGMLVYETRLTSAVPSANLLYDIHVLHCMHGAPGFPQLIGIVVDKTGKTLKSYLTKLPKLRGYLTSVLGRQDITWERRQKWAYQIVDGISQLHEKGFAVGGLTSYSVPVIVDSTDSILFPDFRRKLVPGLRIGNYYPPELLHCQSLPATTNEAACPDTTSKMDIFHLGSLLWVLAENKPHNFTALVCRPKRCSPGNKYTCDLPRPELVALPQLSESIPNYYRSIVDACRADNPRDRPAARDILKLLTYVSERRSAPPKPAELASAEFSLLMRKHCYWAVCDNCLEEAIQPPFFHCNICLNGDFDICQKCYDSGKHCFDNDHMLVELKEVEIQAIVQRYHGSVNNSGARKIVEM